MPKLLWALLPLLAVAAWLAWHRLRGRRPSRHALNIGFSLLLLAYLGATAGLGIFWVANQQLPVFDWHYLFGYATLLLLALHLGFNFRIVWRFFVRARSATPTATAPAAAPRRRWLGWAGALGAVAAAYMLGLRQGRHSAPLAAGSGDALAWVEQFHTLSSNTRAGLLRLPGVDWGQAPPPFKRYAHAPRLALPPPVPGSGLDLQALATLLWHTAGITQDGASLRLRAAPSSGALFATELYVATTGLPGLASGLWHHDAATHALHRLGEGPGAGQALAAAADGSAQGATLLIVATAVFRRSGHKYRDRTYRYVLADLGHALENLRLAALALGWQPYFVLRFDDARCAEVLSLDTAEEGVLALLALRPAAAQAPGLDAPRRWLPAPLPAQHALGLTGTMHETSSLRLVPGAATAQEPASPAPAGPAVPVAVLQTIATRRSQRRFAADPLPLSALNGVLAALAAPAALLPGQTLHVHLVAHAVQGLAAGAYRYDLMQKRLQPSAAPAVLRDAARRAALDQDVIGDAAAVLVLAIDRDALRTDPLGPARAYRHALLHAGCIGERFYLEAGARGLAVCAVGAFHDDEATALVAADAAREWIVHFAAIGTPTA